MIDPADPIEVRPWQPGDQGFLWDVLLLSLHVPDGAESFPRTVLDEHSIAHYLEGFGKQDGDDALVAVAANGRIGAAFCRRFTDIDPGYGFVDASTPELGMAVVPAWRGRGVGRALLHELVARHPRMSLSVDLDNRRAIRLYDTLGFRQVGASGTSITMLRHGPGALPVE